MLVKGLLPPGSQNQQASAETTQKAIDYENAKPVFELQNYSGYGFSNIP
mgnify:FL=1